MPYVNHMYNFMQVMQTFKIFCENIRNSYSSLSHEHNICISNKLKLITKKLNRINILPDVRTYSKMHLF